MVATALSRATSSPRGKKAYPEQLAARFSGWYLHLPTWGGRVSKCMKAPESPNPEPCQEHFCPESLTGPSTHPSYVWVGLLRGDAVVLDIPEGIRHEATVAPVVAVLWGAVHQILSAQGHPDARLLLELPLQSAGGTEGPTRATSALQFTKRRLAELRLNSIH